jgi:hypothetical protein
VFRQSGPANQLTQCRIPGKQIREADAKSGKPERIGHVLVLDPVSAQFAERLLRLLEITFADQQNAFVVKHHLFELRIGARAKLTPLPDVREGVAEAAELELAQPQHYPGRSDFWTEGCRL